MTDLGLFNRLDRSELQIAELAIDESNKTIDSGVVLVRRTNDGSQGTYDVRHYVSKEAIPAFLKGKLFEVTSEGVRPL